MISVVCPDGILTILIEDWEMILFLSFEELPSV